MLRHSCVVRHSCALVEKFALHSLLFGLLVFVVMPAHADVILQHIGANDFATEGWRLTAGDPGDSVKPVFNDQGTGLDAWSMGLDTTVGAGVNYFMPITTQQAAQASSNGWLFSTNMRVGGRGFQFIFDLRVENATIGPLSQGSSYSLYYLPQDNGDLLIDLSGVFESGEHNYITLVTLVTLAADDSGYHLYQCITARQQNRLPYQSMASSV
jgi:hypothetical protein